MKGIHPIEENQIQEAITKFLVNFPFFAGLNEDELSIIAEHLDFLALDNNTTIVREYEPGDCVYFVIDGELEVFKESVGGRKAGVDHVVLNRLIKGSSFGEIAIIDDYPRSASVRASAGSTVVSLNRSGFNQILEGYPKIGVKLLKEFSRIICRQLRRISAKYADNSLSEVQEVDLDKFEIQRDY